MNRGTGRYQLNNVGSKRYLVRETTVQYIQYRVLRMLLDSSGTSTYAGQHKHLVSYDTALIIFENPTSDAAMNFQAASFECVFGRAFPTLLGRGRYRVVLPLDAVKINWTIIRRVVIDPYSNHSARGYSSRMFFLLSNPAGEGWTRGPPALLHAPEPNLSVNTAA